MMMTTTSTSTPTQKRKAAADQVNHDFSDLSLSSPPTKIRRLVEDCAPIMEEDEQQQQTIAIAAAAAAPEDEERAIVLFNPNPNFTLTQPPPPPTFSLAPHFLSHLKAQPDLCSNLLNNSPAQHNDDAHDISNQCLAVVPWVHSHLSPPPPPPQLDASMMEAQQQNQQEIASMEIEQQEEYNNNNGYAASSTEPQFRGTSVVGFHPWQQQHCMVPSQLPHNFPAAAAAAAAAAPAPTPAVWFL